MPSSIAETAAEFAGAVARLGGRCCYVGGIAVVAWGRPRHTEDLDVILELAPGAENGLAAELTEAGLQLDPRDLSDARSDDSHVTVHTDGLLHIDIVLACSPIHDAELGRAVEIEVDGARFPVCAPEDAITHKLRFGSPRDVEDAEGMLVVQWERLDWDLLRRLATEHGVRDRLDAMVEELRSTAA